MLLFYAPKIMYVKKLTEFVEKSLFYFKNLHMCVKSITFVADFVIYS